MRPVNENCLLLLGNSNLQLTQSFLLQAAHYSYLGKYWKYWYQGPTPWRCWFNWSRFGPGLKWLPQLTMWLECTALGENH